MLTAGSQREERNSMVTEITTWYQYNWNNSMTLRSRHDTVLPETRWKWWWARRRSHALGASASRPWVAHPPARGKHRNRSGSSLHSPHVCRLPPYCRCRYTFDGGGGSCRWRKWVWSVGRSQGTSLGGCKGGSGASWWDLSESLGRLRLEQGDGWSGSTPNPHMTAHKNGHLASTVCPVCRKLISDTCLRFSALIAKYNFDDKLYGLL